MEILLWTGVVNTATVKITSQTDETGCAAVTLTETGKNTGIFRNTIDLITGASVCGNTPPDLKVAGVGSDVMTVTYSDASPSGTRTAALTIENTSASFSATTPAHNFATTSTTPRVSGTVTDATSGVKKSTVKVRSKVDSATSTDVAPGTITSVTSGYDVIHDIASGISADGAVLWWLVASDNAGNFGASDRVAPSALAGTVTVTSGSTTVQGVGTAFVTKLVVGDTIKVGPDIRRVSVITDLDTLTVNNPGGTAAFPTSLSAQVATKSECSPSIHAGVGLATISATDNGGCDPFAIKVDNTAPTLDAATTGWYWDTALTTTDKTQKTLSKAKTTSIRVDFNEGLDATTVAASDFTVTSPALTVSSATVYSGLKTSVFLTIGTMASDSRPKVTLAGEIKNEAGKALTTGSITAAADKIPPVVTVTLTSTTTSTTRALGKGAVTITVLTDEGTNTPVIQVRKVGGTAVNNGGNTLQTATTLTPTPTGVARTWSVSYSPSVAGLYNVYATAQDINASNLGTRGETAVAGDDIDLVTDSIQIDLAKAVLFEKDTGIAAPTFTPADKGSSDNPDTYITIDFTNEGKEYGLTTSAVDGDGKEDGELETTTPASVSVDYDAHGKITLVHVKVDSVDVTSSTNTRDNVKFSVRPGSLALGARAVEVKVTDDAGNSATFKATITIKARALYKVPLDPGSNLISVPAALAVTDINTVIASTSPVTTVLTFDNATGLWLVATRDTDSGELVGNLSSIDNTHAYWVVTDEFVNLEVDLPRVTGGTATFPVSIPVFQGWNMIPVVDTNQSSAGTTIAANTYFANLVTSGGAKTWTAYEFDTVANSFTKIVAGGNLKVSKGYFLYVTEDGVIVP